MEPLAFQLVAWIEPREIGRYIGVRQLGLGAGYNPHPRTAGLGDGWKHDDVVEKDGVRLDAAQKCHQLLFDSLDGIDDGFPCRADIGWQLRLRIQIEVGQLVAD